MSWFWSQTHLVQFGVYLFLKVEEILTMKQTCRTLQRLRPRPWALSLSSKQQAAAWDALDLSDLRALSVVTKPPSWPLNLRVLDTCLDETEGVASLPPGLEVLRLYTPFATGSSFRLPMLDRLRVLACTKYSFSSQDLLALGRSCPNLRRLSAHRLSPDGLEALTSLEMLKACVARPPSRVPATLTTLILSGLLEGFEFDPGFAGFESVTTLRLGLRGRGLPFSFPTRFLRLLGQLVDLTLLGSVLDPASLDLPRTLVRLKLDTLCDSDTVLDLRALESLEECWLSSVGSRRLFFPASLRVLTLHQITLHAQLHQSLRSAPETLRSLSLVLSVPGNFRASVRPDAPVFSCLESLSLSLYDHKPSCWLYLLRAFMSPSVKSLSLGGRPHEVILPETRALTLSTLDLACAKFSDAAVIALLEMHASSLESVTLTWFSRYDLLTMLRPDCRLRSNQAPNRSMSMSMSMPVNFIEERIAEES